METKKHAISRTPVVRKKPVLRKKWNFVLTEKDCEHDFGGSLTQPDQSYTPKQLLERFVKGLPTSVKVHDSSYNPAVSFDSPDLEKFHHLDIVDRMEILEQAKRSHAAIKKSVDEADAKRQAKQKEEEKLSSEIKKDFLSKQKKSAAGPADSGAEPAKGASE